MPEDDWVNSSSSTDSETSSDSQTQSSVGAQDCDSALKELEEDCILLKSLSKEMQEKGLPSDEGEERVIPLRRLVKQMETLLQSYCHETKSCVQNWSGKTYMCTGKRLAETVAELLQSVLTHPSKGLVDAGMHLF